MVIESSKVEKEIIRAGNEAISTHDDTKIKFFYQVRRCSDGKVLDDNRPSGQPLEMVFGKKFKLEVWEECLKTLQLNEIARFVVHDVDLLISYPLVAKSLRDIAKKEKAHACGHDHHDGAECDNSRSHCCGMQSLLEKGLGYPDLDEFMKNPEKLEFVFELTEAFAAGTYEKDSWAMDSQEKLNSVPRLHQEGNHFYSKKKYVEAADRYSRALAALEDLQGKEKPGSEEWVKLDSMMSPLLLNYVQCQLILGHYREAIDHATTIIDKDPTNVKARYRRAKAHAMAWNPKEAREDFAVALQLDSTLRNAIAKDLRELDRTQAIRDTEDREKMRNLFG